MGEGKGWWMRGGNESVGRWGSSNSEVDTETLIALVSSIVNDRLPQIETSSVLDAILRCDGDVESAASYLLQKHTNPVDPKGKKRAHSGLDAWLQRGAPSPKRRKDKERSPEPTDSSLTRPRHSSPAPTLLSILQHHTTNTNTNASSPKKPPSSSSSSSSRKPKPPSSIPRLPPLTLPSPAMVAQHTPCTLHPAVLPPALACRLFYTMLDRARAGWTRNKWWLFERMVESPHRTAFFVRKDLAVKEDADADEWTEAARYWYNGTPTDAPPAFPPEMEEACYIIERVVNAEMRKRKRFDMEWRPPSPPSQSHTSHTSQSDTHPPQADTHPSQSDTREPLWRANVAASNCYEGGKESVGWHSDQLTYLGPCPTIASLSLGTRRTFSLRDVVPADEQETRHARTYNIPLPHNSLIIMHATTQERFKHAVPPQRAVDVYKPAGFPPRAHAAVPVRGPDDFEAGYEEYDGDEGWGDEVTGGRGFW
ncbi:hypothetical protein EYR40_001320 [Pleurotus pulmonarius]|nr:hypothetical protein EYR40_001320 [Pleurotus pulmonarius]